MLHNDVLRADGRIIVAPIKNFVDRDLCEGAYVSQSSHFGVRDQSSWTGDAIGHSCNNASPIIQPQKKYSVEPSFFFSRNEPLSLRRCTPLQLLHKAQRNQNPLGVRRDEEGHYSTNAQ